jgi:hypothetical protein
MKRNYVGEACLVFSLEVEEMKFGMGKLWRKAL